MPTQEPPKKAYSPPVVKILDTSASPGSREEIEEYMTGRKSESRG